MLEAATLVLVGFAFLAALAAWLQARAQRSAVQRTADLTARMAEVLRRQEALVDAMRGDVAQIRSELHQEQSRSRAELAATLVAFRTELRESLAGVRNEMQHGSAMSEQRFETLRAAVDLKLQSIREDNNARLEQMRATVDEKLQSTLEARLGESFRVVSEQLDRVRSGLTEMQALAVGVGDLKRVLTNVKTRGTWGEIQLGVLLEQILTPDQYATNVAVREGSQDRVEFAIRLPGRGENGDAPVWLPIDAKFPQEDYLRLEDARAAGDPVAVEAAAKALEQNIRNEAKTIFTKYLDPPRTTDIGIMFVPTEGLYAEVARRPRLLESLQRDYRVLVAGPSTLAALLNSLQMGFRTLAIQKRSSEVWTVLGNVKTHFTKFEALLAKVHRKLQEATTTVEETQKRSRILGTRMRDVEALPIDDGFAGLEVSDNDDAAPAIGPPSQSA